MASKDVNKEPTEPRRSRWRWLRKPVVWALTLLLLFGSIVLTIHLILRSDLPRQWVIDIAEAETGLRVEIDSLRAHWDGSTDIRGLRVGLPLAGDDLLSVVSVRVQHARPWLLPFMDIGLEHVVVTEPTVAVRQDAAGRWNVDELVTLLSSTSATAGSGPLVALPQVEIVDAKIDIVDAHQRAVALRDVSLRGQPATGAGWTFRLDLDASGTRTISGQLVTAGSYTHDLTFTLNEPLSLVEPLLDVTMPASSLRGRWTGSLADEKLSGTLTLDALQLADADVKGAVAIVVSTAGVEARAIGLTVTQPSLPGEQMRIDSGIVTFDGTTASVHDMTAHVAGGSVKARASYDTVTRSGAGTVNVEGVSWAGMAIDVKADAELTEPIVGDMRLTLDTEATGSSEAISWRSGANLKLQGAGLEDIAWSASVRDSSLTQGEQTLRIASAEARGRMTWPIVAVESATVNSLVTVQATGSVDVAKQSWVVDARAADLLLGNPYDDRAKPQPHVLSFHAEGAGRSMTISDGRLDGPRLRATFSASYGENGVQPLRLDVDARAESLRFNTPWDAEVRTGATTAKLIVHGALNPMLMSVKGELIAGNVSYADQPLGRIVFPLEGVLMPTGRVQIKSTDVKLFDGTWQIEGNAELATGDVQVAVDAAGVQLQRIDALLPESQRLRGVTALRGIKLLIPRGDLDRAAITGDLHVASLSARGFKLGTLESKVHLTAEAADLIDLKLRQGEGTITGKTHTLLVDNVPTEANLQLAGWPLQWPGIDAIAIVDGAVNAQVDATGLLNADVTADAALTFDKQNLGSVNVEARYNNDRIHLAKLTGSILNGEIEGFGDLSLATPFDSTATVQWRDIDLPTAVAMVPQLALLKEHGEILGSVAGQMSVGPSEDRRAKGAAEVRLTVDPDGASMRGIAIQGGSAKVFVYPERVVVDEANVALEEGSIKAWGRATKRSDGVDVFVSAKLDTLDVAPLLAAVSADSQTMPGKLSGELTLHLPPRGMDLADGRANLTIVESDLARLGPLTALYNAMNLSVFSAADPRGEGALVARIEAGNLYLSEARYTNRGTYARASGVVRDVRKGRDSDVEIIAIGSFQPLPTLLFLKDVDDMIRSIQQNLAAVQVTGTLGEPESRAVSEASLTRYLRKMLTSESGAQSSGPQ